MGDHKAEPKPSDVSVTYNPDGTRVVTRRLTDSEGKVRVIKHTHPDTIKHHYQPFGEEKEIPLYSGPFSLSEHEDRPYNGEVFFTWKPTPRIEIKGHRNSTPEDLDELFSDNNIGVWRNISSLSLDLPNQEIPPQADTSPNSPSKDQGDLRIERRIHTQVGDGTSLDEVTFLVPNGWRAEDAFYVCDPEKPEISWPARTSAQGDGWAVDFDILPGITLKKWKELKKNGGYTFTHTGRLKRADGSRFNSIEASQALDRISLGLRLAVGRRTSCLLPVGFLSGSPKWVLWGTAAVDPMTNASDLLEETISAKQVSELVSRVLDFTTTTENLQSFKNALAYYIAATVDVDVHLTASLPISGLQLLTYYHNVTTGPYSATKWENTVPKNRATEWEVRKTLDLIQVKITIPQHFQYLPAVSHQMAKDGAPRDALGVVIKMRNVATHPTKKQSGAYKQLAWAEAGMLAKYWLCLALLYTINYQGEVAAILQSRPRRDGEVRKVPWNSASKKAWAVGDPAD